VSVACRVSVRVRAGLRAESWAPRVRAHELIVVLVLLLTAESASMSVRPSVHKSLSDSNEFGM